MDALLEEAKHGDRLERKADIAIWEAKLQTVMWRGKMGSLDINIW